MEEVGSATGLSEERTFDLKVAVSEACANAIEHARGGVEILARLLPDRVMVEITNVGVFHPAMSLDTDRRRGLGLPLMATLADQVHISRLPGGRTRISLTFFLELDAGQAPVHPEVRVAAGGSHGRWDSGAAQLLDLGRVFERVAAARSFKEAGEGLLGWAQELTGCDAAMLRLVEPKGEPVGWIPALVHRGLSPRFLQDEALIGAEECLCGRVCQGLGDPGLPFFTRGGSFLWGRVQSIGQEFSEEVLGSVRGRCILEGYDSIAIFPLMSADEPVGSLHLADFAPEKFSLHAELLETACRTCGSFLHGHKDHEFEQATIAAVECALMPRQAPQVEGLDIAVAFTSATEGARVGGDFYDVLELDSGATLLFVGDCTGNGIQVAGMAARVRQTLANLGRADDDPGELLNRANRVLKETLPAGRLVTAVVCRCSREGELTAAVAGHPRPLRLEEGGGAEEISLPPNAPLAAVSGKSFATGTLRLSPGQTLLLFTDGISESRHADEFFGTEGIARVWRKMRGRPIAQFADTLCRESERFHRNGHSRDDRLVLAARLVG
jgi:anti-sigma regulatory factor (Ser/Thr protein kinase)